VKALNLLKKELKANKDIYSKEEKQRRIKEILTREGDLRRIEDELKQA